MASSLPSRKIENWMVSPGLYSPTKVESEPALPILTPFTAVMISLSLSPAFSAAESFMMAEELYLPFEA